MPILDASTLVGRSDASSGQSSGDLSAPPDASSDEAEDATLDAIATIPCDSAVPVCLSYFTQITMCLDRDVLATACDPFYIPDGAARLAEIESICEVNLQRIETACR